MLACLDLHVLEDHTESGTLVKQVIVPSFVELIHAILITTNFFFIHLI